MNILLFDMDGVLLEAHGYHLALQETVRQVASALGFPGATLSRDDIAAFEASGMSSEWDTAATCAALLLQAAWRVDPQRKLHCTKLLSSSTSVHATAPDFYQFAISLGQPALHDLTPLERARYLLLSQDGQLTADQRLAIQDLLLNARQVEHSITYRLFQELVLGSQEYARIYPFAPQLDTPGYLCQYDRPSLDTAQKSNLDAWLIQPEHSAAILTSRPNLPPPGFVNPPEAESGAALVGLSSLPISGWGGLCWLGARHSLDPQKLLKPHPVHALAALQMALGMGKPSALEEAARLGWHGESSTAWLPLQGARVSVFEDTPGGVRSLHAAQQMLRWVGVKIDIHCFGVTGNPTKRQALEQYGARVFPSLAEALVAAGILEK